MHRTSLVAVLGVVLFAAQGAPARAAEDRVVALDRATPVREYAGWLLFSRWDGTAYHLTTWHDGHERDLRVPPQRKPFDADTGPDADGHPSAVVSLCHASCDLFVIGFADGDALRPVRNANTDGHDEISPSVWRGRLVFGRRYDRDTVVSYTKRLAAPRHRPSRRLAGLPARRCGAVERPHCRRIEDVRLGGMELWGRWVTQSWSYQPDAFPGFSQNEIRLTDVDRSDTRQLAFMTAGLGGQTYLGPSIAEGRVAFFKACHGDPGGCSTSSSGAIRYRISTGDYDHVGAREGWSGWAWTGAAGYHVPSAFDCSGGDPGSPPRETCGVIRRTGLQWSSADATHFR